MPIFANAEPCNCALVLQRLCDPLEQFDFVRNIVLRSVCERRSGHNGGAAVAGNTTLGTRRTNSRNLTIMSGNLTIMSGNLTIEAWEPDDSEV